MLNRPGSRCLGLVVARCRAVVRGDNHCHRMAEAYEE